MENHSDKPLAKQKTSKKKHETTATNKRNNKNDGKVVKEKGASPLMHDDDSDSNSGRREQKRISHQEELKAHAKRRREQQQLQQDGDVEPPASKTKNHKNLRENQNSRVNHCDLNEDHRIVDYYGSEDNEELEDLDLRRIPDIAPGAFAIDEDGEVLRGRGKHNITTVEEIEEGGLWAREKNDRFAPLAPVERAGASSDGSEDDKDRKRRGKRFIVALGVMAVAVVSTAVAVPVALSTSKNEKNNDGVPTAMASPTLAPTQSPTAAPINVIPANWQPVGQVLRGKAAEDYFGNSVSLSHDGSVMAVGADQRLSSLNPGYVVVQRHNPSTQQWTQIGQDLKGQAGGDNFGESVSLNGDGTILAVGADRNDSGGSNVGHARVFEYDSLSDRWVQLGSDILGNDAGDWFGYSVSLSDAGDILAVGAFWDDTENGDGSGSVRLFEYDRGSSSWNQLGQTLIGQATGGRFGISASLNALGTIVGIGADDNDSGGSNAGQVSVYEYNSASSRWDLLGGPINGQIVEGRFGISVSLDDSGLIMAVGAPGPSNEKVLVYSYDRSTLTWSQRGQTLLTQQPIDDFGWSVSLSGNGNVLAVGSDSHDVNGFTNAGQVRIFQYDSSTSEWQQVGNPLTGEANDDRFGFSVSLSADGSVVGVGAYRADVNGDSSGSAYAFTVNGN